MAGHRKWSNVQHINSVLDQKRGKFVSEIANETTVAATLGGCVSDASPHSRATNLAARAESLRGDQLNRPFKCASERRSNAGQLQEIVCEGTAPGEMAIHKTASKHKSRTIADLRLIFINYRGQIASSGRVRNKLKRQGQVTVPSAVANDDKMREVDAEDVNTGENYHVIIMAHDQLYTVGELLMRVGTEPDAQKLTYLPDTAVHLAVESTSA
jgi:transcriptional/translational regulatory protein YebC/TACO1